MNIDSIELFHIGLLLRKPLLTPLGPCEKLETVIAAMHSGGTVGWGEASPGNAPLMGGEWAAGAFAVLRDWLAPAVVGASIDSGGDLGRRLAPFRGNQFAKAALDTAWWDLHSRLQNRPLHQLLGGSRDAVEVGPTFDRMCRAELRVETPTGTWTVRLATPVYDEPAALLWDTAGLFVVKYGFVTYAFQARSGELRWTHRSGTPVGVILGSSRLPHVIVQAEIETFAIAPDGEVAWRVAHSDVVTEAELVGGRLILTSYGGLLTALDPRTGRPSTG